MRGRRLAVLALALVPLAACSSSKKTSPPPRLEQATTTTVAPTPVVAKIVAPEAGSVQGSGGRGMVVVLTFTAADPAALPAQFRLGGQLPAPATPAKPGRNPAFPGLVVGATTTPAALGGPSANLANLFQIVSPAAQPDGSMRVTAVWTNAQPNFGTDVDITVGALTVAGDAPDVVPQPLTDMSLNSNVASVTFRLAGGDTTATSVTTSTTTRSVTTSTVRSSTTSTTRARAGGGASTTVAPTTTTTRRTVTSNPPATTSTTKFLGLF